MKKINTIDVSAKEWLDKQNANSYFSARITLNFGQPDQTEIKLPFQYGYDDHYLQMTFKALQDNGYISKDYDNVMWRYCEANNIILNASKQTGCKKSEVTAYGK